jgi:hypothetical protein
MNFLKRFPVHPVLFGIYPVLALLATNIAEVEIGVVLRPLLFSLIFSAILMLVTFLILKDFYKAAVVTSFFIILFFTYGHVYQLIELKEIFGVNIGRHRYLIPFYLMIGGLGLWLILRKVRDYYSITQVMNMISIFLVIFPILQILLFIRRISLGESAVVELNASEQLSELQAPDELPDIYYIVLDTYTRADALQRDFNFNNVPFLDDLRSLGFYVADCSRSNYSYTQGSITAALNMEYLPDLHDDLKELGLGAGDIWVLMKQSRVRRTLEELGYQTIAFETGYEWSRLRDADLYLGSDSYNIQGVSPFESMFIKTTALIILTDSPNWWMMERMKAINFPYGGYVQTQRSILNQLPQLPYVGGPRFVFAHVLIPHVPYVFDPQGNVREDPGYYGGKLAGPTTEQYLVEGYTGEIQFINSRILEIVRDLLENSNVPPIIVIHGDHGLRDENRLQILNAYFLPDVEYDAFYPSISPVNSFRVVFDTFFGTDYGLLVDESFMGDDTSNPIPEYSPDCWSN